MANTGNIFAGTGENNNGIGATAWSTPTNITSDNTTDATCNAAASSQYLVARNFDFSTIPTGAVINGILVRVEASEHSGGTEPLLAQLQNEAGNLFGSSKSTSNEGAINGTGKSVYTYGSTSDVWGASLTDTIVKDADFGVRFWFTSAHDVRIDYVTMAVEYTLIAALAGNVRSSDRLTAVLTSRVALASSVRESSRLWGELQTVGGGATALEGVIRGHSRLYNAQYLNLIDKFLTIRFYSSS
jgi:hypothetical protein